MNFWLPASYHTPRVVVSALFAGLLTKVGVYALLRSLLLILPDAHDALAGVIAWVAILTMMTAALGALAQTDLRRLLGYLVISGIGIMLAGLAIATEAALAGTVFYAVHSIVVMTALYMAAGAAGAVAGFSLAEPGGLYRRAGGLAAVTLLLFFAVAGLPPLTGFWPKAMLVRSAIEAEAPWLAGAILLNGFLVTVAVGRAFALRYWRPAADTSPHAEPDPHPEPDHAPTDEELSAEGEEAFVAARARALARPSGPPRRAVLPVATLGALVLALGLYPEPLLALAAEAGRGLLDPTLYLQSVFPDATASIEAAGTDAAAAAQTGAPR